MTSMIRTTRWGTGSRLGSGEAAREQILEAARACYESQGIAKTTVEDVARTARVSRTTVYRYFRNRDEVLTGVVMADSVALVGYLQESLAGITDFSDFLIEAMLLILREAPQAPLYEAFLGPAGDSTGLVSRLCISSEAVIALIGPVLRPRFEQGQAAGTLHAGLELGQVIEWAARLLLSFMVTPSPLAADEPALRRLLDTMLRPALLARPGD